MDIMNKPALIAAVMFCLSAPVYAADEEAAAPKRKSPPVEETSLPAHDRISSTLPAELYMPLHFSKNERTRLEEALSDEIDTVVERTHEEFQMRKARSRKLRYELNDIRFRMFMYKLNLAGALREILKPNQREKLDKLIYEGYLNPVVFEEDEEEDEKDASASADSAGDGKKSGDSSKTPDSAGKDMSAEPIVGAYP